MEGRVPMKRVLVIAAVVVLAGAGAVIVRQVLRKEAPTEEARKAETVRDVAVYFASTDAASLVAEPRRIPASDDPLVNVRAVVEALIKGPSEDLVATLPPAAKVRNVYLFEKTAYIDFTREIAEEAGGSASEYLLVASLVQTVCGNFDAIAAVRILVEGEEVDTLGGHLYIRKPLVPKDWR